MRNVVRLVRRSLAVTSLSVAGALVAGVFVVVIAQVFSRFVLGSPLDGTDELARLIFVWLTFVGAGSIAATQAGHIAASALTRKRGGLPAPMVVVVQRAMVFLACLVITYATAGTVKLSALQVSTSLGVSMSWLYLAPLIGMGLIAIHQLINPIRAEDEESGEPETMI
ncbi:TRAP transporter small permease [Ruania halotolerans]|uniref:TRAP transporter small permease n=1 Tax=Ruania halotolerans TaxID=2897773 RepID=UPI001E47AEF9|nr:TRAP transporter small permease [Ruania halotolerans]UFU06601.1 TRAP transporter small permease [Ruania halotolerans]